MVRFHIGFSLSIRTSQVSSQHEIQHKEAVLVVLKRIPHVHDERVVDL